MIECRNYTYEQFHNVSIGSVVEAVIDLTRKRNETYHDYLTIESK